MHPTEGYLVTGAIDGLTETGGVFHYTPKDHLLECRRNLPEEEWGALRRGFPEGTLFVGLTSIHWREAWKYGERAYRYCQHDAGHAMAACALSAAVLGWSVQPLPELGDREITKLLGLDRVSDFDGAEEEHPDVFLAVMPATTSLEGLPQGLPPAAIERMGASL